MRDARQPLMQIPHVGELALAHVFSYVAAMDKGLQRLSWSQQKLPDAQLPLWQQTPERGWRYAGQAASSLRVPVGLRKRHETGCILCKP